MRSIIMALCIAVLSGCTTPVTMLKNPKTGQVARCGGGQSSALTGVWGYLEDKQQDADCVKSYQKYGFEAEKQK